MKIQCSTLRTVFYYQGYIFGLKRKRPKDGHKPTIKPEKADIFPSLSLKMNKTSLKVIFKVSLPLENRRILDQKYTDIKTIRTNL